MAERTRDTGDSAQSARPAGTGTARRLFDDVLAVRRRGSRRRARGDSPPANIFNGTAGDLYSDFELVTLGPVEWDLAALGPDLEAAYNRGARRNGMRPLDDEVLRFVNAVGVLRAIAVLTLSPQLPALVEFLQPLIDQWHDLPFAGGLDGFVTR
ncbi:hypothetical protein ACIBCD_24305 [Nocardia brasiliensis]|uniref:hypothetical protein n=1 Tax=Nocardia brasiliensis TaxID=37326 RepID=UPI0037A44B8A